MDYGKFKFDEAQRARESRRKSTNVSLKEMKYRLKIGPGDFDTKTRKVAGFLSEGHKVKITIMFRGREVERPQFGQNLLNKIADNVNTVGRPESMPRLDGRNMVMVLAPDKRAQASAKDTAGRQTAGDATPTTTAPAEPAPPDATPGASDSGNGAQPDTTASTETTPGVTQAP